MTVTHVDFGAPPPVEHGFRSLDVCHIADVSYRQLDYWARTDLAVPTVRVADGSGTQRLYSDQDVLRVALVATLLRAGFSLSVLREHLDQLLRTAADGIGVFTAPNVVVTIDLGALTSRVELHKARLAEQAATS